MYCETCMQAARDEGATDDEVAELVLADLGADIADHCCEYFVLRRGLISQETGEPCECACH